MYTSTWIALLKHGSLGEHTFAKRLPLVPWHFYYVKWIKCWKPYVIFLEQMHMQSKGYNISHLTQNLIHLHQTSIKWRNNVYPCNPSFTIWKWGSRGSKLHRLVNLMFGLLNWTWLLIACDTAVYEIMSISWRYATRERIRYDLSMTILVTIQSLVAEIIRCLTRKKNANFRNPSACTCILIKFRQAIMF